jgi:hypothetical protein
MRRRVIGTWVLLVALLSWWHGAESAWESTGVLVLDISRSMQDNDPHNIRGDGEQTFIDLLSSVEGNHLGIVFFGAKARVMKPITPIQRETTKSLKDSLPPVDSRAQRTEIGLGLARGLAMLEGRGGTRYLVVMSDGELDRSGRAAQRWTADDELALRELRALYAKLRQEQIPVFTIALTEASRKTLSAAAEPSPQQPVQMTRGELLLKEIAENTGGKFYRILRRRDYLDAFLDIFLHVRPPTLYTRPRQAEAKFFLNRFDSEAIVIGPREMVLVAPDGRRFGLGLPASAVSPWIRLYPYQHWSLAIISRPAGDVAAYEGMYQVVDQAGNPLYDHKVLVQSAITLAWERPPKATYALHEVLPIAVKIQSLGLGPSQEGQPLAHFLQGAEIVASVWAPQAPLPVSQRLMPLGHDGAFVFAGTYEATRTEGEYRLEVELVSEPYPSLNRKIGTTFTVGPPAFHFAVLRLSEAGTVQVLASRQETAQAPVYAGDRVELLAELAGGTAVDFRHEPTIRAEIARDGHVEQVVPLERVREGEAVRYRSQPVVLPAAGAYAVTFRAEGHAMAEVWDDRLISTRSWRVHPIQIVFRGSMTVAPTPWTPGRILTYVGLGGGGLALVTMAGMAAIAQLARTPLRGWLLSSGRGTPQLFVLSGNPTGGIWRRLFPRTRATIGTASDCDHRLDLRDTGVEIEAEIYVGAWWDRSGAIYLRSRRQPSHVYVNGVEVVGSKGVVLADGETLEKPTQVRFGKYEMTFDT